MAQNEHTAWQRSAMEFEAEMIQLTSFAYSGAADECLHLHSDRWGLPRLGAYEPHRRYATQEAALGYARVCARRAVSAEQRLAVQAVRKKAGFAGCASS